SYRGPNVAPITVACDDVLSAPLDPSDTVFFLYNPWIVGSPVWDAVLSRIEKFAVEGPRRVYVLYSAPVNRVTFDRSRVLRLVQEYETVVVDFDWCLYRSF